MSRSGYTDDCDDQWASIRYRGAVASATKGARGQALLRELLAALDAMPDKRLVANEFEAEGAYCTLGVLGAKRGIDMKLFDTESEGYYDERIGSAFGVADALAREIMYENDECVDDDRWVAIELCGPIREHGPYYERHRRTVRVPVPGVEERRWRYMRAWVEKRLVKPGDGRPSAI